VEFIQCPNFGRCRSKTYRHRSQFQIISGSGKYYFDQLDVIGSPTYVPTVADAIHARVRTTGMVEHEAVINNHRWKLMDFGGARNERKKWIHCFENVSLVIFNVDASAFDCKLYEDEQVNRLEESLNLFEWVCNSRFFRGTRIVLWLNKIDLFREKIKTFPQILSSIRPDFVGPNTFQASITFIKQEFFKRHAYSNLVGIYLTTTTDTRSVKEALEHSLVTDKYVEMDVSFTGINPSCWIFLTGTHPRLGNQSHIFRTLSQNDLYDRSVLRLIFGFV